MKTTGYNFDSEQADRKSPFKVTENYFDTFEDELFAKVFDKPAAPKVGGIKSLKPLLYLAAAFALFVVVDKLILHNTVDKPVVSASVALETESDLLYSTLDEYEVLGLVLDDESISHHN